MSRNPLSRQTEVFVIDVDEVAPLFGNVVLGEYGDNRAYRLACRAVNALVGMDVILVVLVLRCRCSPQGRRPRRHCPSGQYKVRL